MKKRIFGVLLMLLMVMSMGLSASAATKETYFTEDGVEYCWVRGASTEKPTRKVSGYDWIEVLEGNTHVTQVGACDEHGIVNHSCLSGLEKLDYLEYKWQRVAKELLVISNRDNAGYSMEGAAFMLLKENIERDENGDPVIYTNADGEQYVNRIGNDVVVTKAYVESGYATLRLTKEGEYDNRLDWTKEYQQLVLVQNLNPDPNVPIEVSPMLNEYMSLDKRWYVNLRYNADGDYEVYSITEAPPQSTDNYKELKEYHFDEVTEGFVAEYNTTKQIMYLKNAFRVGSIIVNINVEGFDGAIPSSVKTNIDITGPHSYRKRVRKTGILEDRRMGDYTVKCSNPITVQGYTEKEPEIKVTLCYPATGETQELTGDEKGFTLSRSQANAELTITYIYYPNHEHSWDEGTVTDPTCTEQGYTTYTCTGYDYEGNRCTGTKQEDYLPPFGHEYEERVIKASCTESGYTIYTCIDCGDTYEEAGAAAHGHEYEPVKTDPKCGKEGYTTYTCIHCGLSYKDDYTDALEHNFLHTDDEEAGCETEAKMVYTCEACGETKEETTGEALGHDLKLTKTVAATCTESGYDLYECSRCDKTMQEKRSDLPATGHFYGKAKLTSPTCTEKGYTTYSCTVKNCGYSYDGDYKDALGHTYNSQVVAPTTEREGYTLHTCILCEDTYTDTPTAKLTSGSSGSSDSSSSDKGSSSSNKGSSSSNKGSSSGSSANTSSNASDTIVVKFYDEDNEPLNSGAVSLYDGDTLLKSWTCSYDNVVVVDNLENYAKAGKSVSYTLKQSKAMDGYEVSADTFNVELNKQGSTLKINVKKNGNVFSALSRSSTVETGRDGKPIVSLLNAKETTKFEISCKVAVEFEDGCYADETMLEEYQQKLYKFTLNWTDEDGEAKAETITLANGDKGKWKAELPYGTEYEITVADPDGNSVTGLSKEGSGVLSAKQMDANVRVEADLEYQVQPAEASKLEMNVVDSDTEAPIKGANFELKGPDGEKIATYISRENGKFYMEDVFSELGDYLLTQTKAAEGYDTLNGGVPITVALAYTPISENNVQMLSQTKAVTFAHQEVSEEADENFTIENKSIGGESVKTSDTGTKTEKSGSKMGMLLGIGGGALALGAGAAAFVMIKKKRSLSAMDGSEDADDMRGGDPDEE